LINKISKADNQSNLLLLSAPLGRQHKVLILFLRGKILLFVELSLFSSLLIAML